MAIDVVRATRKHWSIDDYIRFGKISSPLPGVAYLDRMKVLDQLIDDGVVYLEDRKICFRSIESASWVERGLLSGSTAIWKFADFADPHSVIVGKFDSAHQAEIGAVGEDAVLALLHRSVPKGEHHRIKQISLTNDGAGFDVLAPSIVDLSKNSLLEVKTSSRPGKMFSFFISRNEFRVGKQNLNWHIAAVRIENEVPRVLGHLDISFFESWIPLEHDSRAEWQSMKLTVRDEDFEEGLP